MFRLCEIYDLSEMLLFWTSKIYKVSGTELACYYYVLDYSV
jgi:hypothetical protein